MTGNRAVREAASVELHQVEALYVTASGVARQVGDAGLGQVRCRQVTAKALQNRDRGGELWTTSG
jgi:hypothetical protein